MSKKDLQRAIRRNEGYILSEGTLNLVHLLTSAYDLLNEYNIKSAQLKKDIESVFNNTGEFKDDKEKMIPSFGNQFYGWIEIPDDKMEEASYIWNEDIFYFFNEIAPNGYYFGSQEGDGALIGFWQFLDDEF